MHEHSLSISSGSEKSRTYASIGFLGDNGWSIADKVNRYTVNFRNDFDVSSKIRTSVQVVGSLRQQDAPGSFTRQSDVVTGSFSRDFDINPFSYALNTSRALRPYDDEGNLEYITMNYAPFNILSSLRNNQLHLTVADVKLQGEPELHDRPGTALQLHRGAALRADHAGARNHRARQRRQRLPRGGQLDHPQPQPVPLPRPERPLGRTGRRAPLRRLLQHGHQQDAQLRRPQLAQLHKGLGYGPHARA